MINRTYGGKNIGKRHFKVLVIIMLISSLTVALSGCDGGGGGGGRVIPRDPTTPTAPVTSKPSYLSVKSDPPGATVEVGVQMVNMVYTPGTGRKVGVTPLTVELKSSDISSISNGEASIYVELQKKGYFPNGYLIGLGRYGKLEPGRTYYINVKLDPLS